MSLDQRLRQIRGNLSQKEMARRIGVHLNTYANYERGKRQPGYAFIRRVTELFQIDEHWLLTGMGTMQGCGSGVPRGEREARVQRERLPGEEVVFVPRLTEVRGREDGFPEIRSDPQCRYAFSKKWLAGKGPVEHMRLLEHTGNAMESTLVEGDLLLLNCKDPPLVAGALYAFLMEDILLVRRLDVRPGEILFLCDNKRYEPIRIPLAQLQRIAVIGRVIWLGREL